MKPEHELVLACAATRLDAARGARVRALVGDARLDWDEVISLARRHWVLPLIAWNLCAPDHASGSAPTIASMIAGRQLADESGTWIARSAAPSVAPPVTPPTTPAGALPAAIRATLVQALRANAMWSLRQTASLLELLAALDGAGVRAIAWKGPALAVSAYGHLGLRTYSDLDLLVRATDFDAARRALHACGLRPASPRDLLRPPQVACEWIFLRDDLIVELHWTPSPRLATGLEIEALRVETIRLGGVEVTQLAPADLLVTLCVHAGKHRWDRLQWVVDLAELIRARGADLDWTRAHTLAARTGLSRSLRVGLALARDLAGVSFERASAINRRSPGMTAVDASALDASAVDANAIVANAVDANGVDAPLVDLNADLASDPAAARLAAAMAARMFAAPRALRGVERARAFLFHLAARERLRDKVRYALGALDAHTRLAWRASAEARARDIAPCEPARAGADGRPARRFSDGRP